MAYLYQLKYGQQSYRVQINERAHLASLLLYQIAVFAYFLFILRLGVFSNVSKSSALIIAITIIFLTQLEMSLKEIEDVQTYLLVGSFFKILKSCTYLIILCINGNKGDFFLCFFFFSTCMIGSYTLNAHQYSRPPGESRKEKEKKKKKECEDQGIEYKPEDAEKLTYAQHYHDQQRECCDRKIRANDRWTAFWSVVLTIIGGTAYAFVDTIFTGDSITVLGSISFPLILVANWRYQIWKTVADQINGKRPLKMIPEEQMRAHEIVNQLDFIVEYVSSLITNISDMNKIASYQSKHDRDL